MTGLLGIDILLFFFKHEQMVLKFLRTDVHWITTFGCTNQDSGTEVLIYGGSLAAFMAVISAEMSYRWRAEDLRQSALMPQTSCLSIIMLLDLEKNWEWLWIIFCYKNITRSNEKFILYVPLLQYYYYLLSSSTCQQGSDWLVGRRRTNYHLSLLRRGRGGGRRGVTEELKYALVRTDRLTQSTSADWNKIHNVGKIIYTLLIVLLQACEISQPI